MSTASPRLRKAAARYVRALMLEHGIKVQEVFNAATSQPPKRAHMPAKPKKAPVPLRASAPQSHAAPVVIPSARVGTRARPAEVEIVETESTLYTEGPSHAFDARYQCDPSKPVEGAGFLSEWRSKRGLP